MYGPDWNSTCSPSPVSNDTSFSSAPTVTPLGALVSSMTTPRLPCGLPCRWSQMPRTWSIGSTSMPLNDAVKGMPAGYSARPMPDSDMPPSSTVQSYTMDTPLTWPSHSLTMTDCQF